MLHLLIRLMKHICCIIVQQRSFGFCESALTTAGSHLRFFAPVQPFTSGLVSLRWPRVGRAGSVYVSAAAAGMQSMTRTTCTAQTGKLQLCEWEERWWCTWCRGVHMSGWWCWDECSRNVCVFQFQSSSSLINRYIYILGFSTPVHLCDESVNLLNLSWNNLVKVHPQDK